MEIGDLFYLIILVLFMILGFFNDSRKKKNQENQSQESTPQPFLDDSEEFDLPRKKTSPPPIPGDLGKKYELEKIKDKKYLEKLEREKQAKEGNVDFRSSVNLVTDFSKESSIGSSLYIKDTDGFYDFEDSDTDDEGEIRDDTEDTEDIRYKQHPIISSLTGENLKLELTKGIIYGEILRKKF